MEIIEVTNLKTANQFINVNVILNKNGILIKKGGKESEGKKFKSLKINEDGITIKTK